MRFSVRIAEVRTRIIEGADLQAVSKALQIAQKQRQGSPTEFILLTLEPLPDEAPTILPIEAA